MDNNELFKALFEKCLTELPHNEPIHELKKIPVLVQDDKVFPVESMNVSILLSKQYQYKWNSNVWIDEGNIQQKSALKETVFEKACAMYVGMSKYCGEEIHGKTAVYKLYNEYNLKEKEPVYEKHNVKNKIQHIEESYGNECKQYFIKNATTIGIAKKNDFKKMLDRAEIFTNQKELTNYFMFHIYTYAGEKSYTPPYSKEEIEQERMECRGGLRIDDCKKVFALLKQCIHKDMEYDRTGNTKRTQYLVKEQEHAKKNTTEYER